MFRGRFFNLFLKFSTRRLFRSIQGNEVPQVRQGQQGEGRQGEGQHGEGQRGQLGEGQQGQPGEGQRDQQGEGHHGQLGEGQRGQPGEGQQGQMGEGQHGERGEGQKGQWGEGRRRQQVAGENQQNIKFDDNNNGIVDNNNNNNNNNNEKDVVQMQIKQPGNRVGWGGAGRGGAGRGGEEWGGEGRGGAGRGATGSDGEQRGATGSDGEGWVDRSDYFQFQPPCFVSSKYSTIVRRSMSIQIARRRSLSVNVSAEELSQISIICCRCENDRERATVLRFQVTSCLTSTRDRTGSARRTRWPRPAMRTPCPAPRVASAPWPSPATAPTPCPAPTSPQQPTPTKRSGLYLDCVGRLLSVSRRVIIHFERLQQDTPMSYVVCVVFIGLYPYVALCRF